MTDTRNFQLIVHSHSSAMVVEDSDQKSDEDCEDMSRNDTAARILDKLDLADSQPSTSAATLERDIERQNILCEISRPSRISRRIQNKQKTSKIRRIFRNPEFSTAKDSCFEHISLPLRPKPVHSMEVTSKDPLLRDEAICLKTITEVAANATHMKFIEKFSQYQYPLHSDESLFGDKQQEESKNNFKTYRFN